MNTLDDKDVINIANLAQIAISADDVPVMRAKLQETFEILNALHKVNTEGIEPMSNPFDAVQRLREDVVTETDQREIYQAIAPAVEKGLYVVPKVIE